MRGIAQVGLGEFGQRHLEAWHRLGLGEQLWIVEADESRWGETAQFRFPLGRIVRRLSDVLDQVDAVDIVAATDLHAELLRSTLSAGRDAFVAQPMTTNSTQAREVAELAARTGRLVQVGCSYRHHPISVRLKEEVGRGTFGAVRYVSGNFVGYRPARVDVGVMHGDGFHLLDLFNWLLDTSPSDAYAVCRDHFRRGLEDFAIALLTYPNESVGKVEVGYIQPGRWQDRAFAGGTATKEIVIVGERAIAEADFETGHLRMHEVRQEFKQGTWTPLTSGSRQIPVEPCSPVKMICRELEAFLHGMETREPPPSGPVASGLNVALLIEAIYESARRAEPVRVEQVTVPDAPRPSGLLLKAPRKRGKAA